MPKFLIEASYSAEGMRGLAKDKASGREAAIRDALTAIGGKLDSIYYALGESDVFVLCECPDHVNAAALAFAVCASGLVRTKTIPLLTIAEADQALTKSIGYKPPGKASP
jgi:uncharacterized protein with GYD domain